jgi:hypothetical protein
VAYIHALIKEIGWSDEEYRDYLYQHFLVKSSKELTKKDAVRMIENLKYIKEHEINPFEKIELEEMECEI